MEVDNRSRYTFYFFSFCSGNLIFFGIDSSVVSITRSKILYEMINNKADATSILQVWFSSAWTNKAQVEFQKAVTHLIYAREDDTDVMKLLLYWKDAKMDVKGAKKLWSNMYLRDELDYTFAALANLKNDCDRVDYARYLFTGVIFADETNIKHGNITMFSIPSMLGVHKAEEENFYFTFNFSHPEFEYKGTLMKSMEALMMKKTKELLTLVNEEKVRMDFKVAKVDLGMESMKLLDSIQKLSPRTVDWSNLSDYFSMQDFLKMARAASSKNTVHYVHIMNWTQCYKGANIFDYKDKMPVIKSAFDSYKLSHKDLASKSENYRKMWAEEIKYMNNINVIDWSLSNKCRDKYLDHFFGGKDVKFTSNPPNNGHWEFKRAVFVICGVFSFV